MSSDLTGGLDPAVDYPITDAAVGALTGENHAFWVFDDSGELSLLNCHLQAGETPGVALEQAGDTVGAGWARRRESFTFTLPGEHLLVDFAFGEGTTPEGPGAAGWTFRCVEPFTRWMGRYRGQARATTPQELQAGMIDLQSGTRVPVECDLELTMVVPAWIAGSFIEGPGAAQGLLFEGVPRYEQLYRARGVLRVDGQERSVDGTGLRTHRYGRRDVTGIAGHSWLSAVFPDGRAFGVKRFPTPDGDVLSSEGFTAAPGGPLVGARVLESPWMTSLQYAGEEFAVVLETAQGIVEEITGTLAATSYTMGLGVNHTPGSWVIGHGMAQFTWDRQQTYGLVERSAPIEKLM